MPPPSTVDSGSSSPASQLAPRTDDAATDSTPSLRQNFSEILEPDGPLLPFSSPFADVTPPHRLERLL
ncbi:hypothetical protein BU16DRAFT_247843 [Lophium mytilinum]|uniref:Uncharacterized protein n=1 Tax=Lophium mytilinum TaxID=390894 RepID=A0A6A6R9R1_9PEZI|nr:hypothetical protein BU16DRAFT_247843 [Lophium mytilinum]